MVDLTTLLGVRLCGRSHGATARLRGSVWWSRTENARQLNACQTPNRQIRVATYSHHRSLVFRSPL